MVVGIERNVTYFSVNTLLFVCLVIDSSIQNVTEHKTAFVDQFSDKVNVGTSGADLENNSNKSQCLLYQLITSSPI